MIEKFYQVEVVLLMKFMSLGCIMVKLRSETLLHMSTPQWGTCLHDAIYEDTAYVLHTSKATPKIERYSVNIY